MVWFISVILLWKYSNSDSYGYGFGYSSFNTEISPMTNEQRPYSGITVPTGFNQPKQSFFGKMGKMFSSSQDKPIDYSTQITVPPTQPNQSFFGRMFKKSPEQLSATVPQSSVSVPSSATFSQSSASSATVPSSMTTQSSASSATVPQSSASSATVPQSSAIASPQPSQSLFSKLKDKFSKKTGSTMSSAPSQISDPFIHKVSRLITSIQTEPNIKISSNKKKSLINKLTRITQNPSNGVKILNEVNRELATYK